MPKVVSCPLQQAGYPLRYIKRLFRAKLRKIGTAVALSARLQHRKCLWLFRSPLFGSSIRRLDGEAVGGHRLARTPPRRVTRWPATSIIAPPAPALSSAMNSHPHHVILVCKIAARLFRRCPQRVKSRIIMFPQRVLPLRRPDNPNRGPRS